MTAEQPPNSLSKPNPANDSHAEASDATHDPHYRLEWWATSFVELVSLFALILGATFWYPWDYPGEKLCFPEYWSSTLLTLGIVGLGLARLLWWASRREYQKRRQNRPLEK